MRILVAILLLAAATHSVRAAPMTEIVEALEVWIDAHAPWPRRASPARVRVLPQALVTGRHGGVASDRTRGLYDPETATVTLIAPWRAEDPQDLATLLHELIHHRQAAQYWRCPGAQELPAYRLQEAWLAELGLPLDVNWIEVVMASGCSRRDVHPD